MGIQIKDIVTGKMTHAGAADNVPWTGITGKPETFTPSEHKHDDLYLKLGGGALSGTVTIIRSNASVDTMYYANRTDMDANIGFGIGTSGNRGIYDAKAGGWLLKIDANNTVTFSGTAAKAGDADTLDSKHAKDFASAVHQHAAGDIKSGVFAIGRIPTGTSSTTVALGNHTHSTTSLTQGYLNTHPENNPTIIPFIYNDLAFLTKKGGSCKIYKTTSTDFTAATLTESTLNISGPDNIFDGSPSYTTINTTGEFTVVFDMVLNKTYSWSNVFYIDFGATSWIAKNIYVYAMNSTKESKYVLKNSTTSNALGNWYTPLSHSVTINNTTTQGFDRLRVVLSGFKNTSSSSGKRIAQIGIINYGSAGVSETYISRGGCEGIYGSLIPHTNNLIDLGSSSKKMKGVYATTLYGNLAWDYITGKPTSFTPSEHTHPYLSTGGGTLTGPLSITSTLWNNQLKLTRTSNGSNWGPAISFYDEKGGRGSLFMESNNLFIADVAGTSSVKRQVSVEGHKHTKSDITDFAHTHDDRYYTETEADGRFAPKSHSHNYIANGASSIELNNNSSLANYGGFIDFHFHKKDANDGNKIKPTDTSGNIVTTIPDYTSRIIEDSPGRISVNNTKFTQDSNGKTYVAADYFKGTADKAIDSDTLDGKNADDFALAGHTHSDRIFVTLVPTGTAIPANADLKTTQYLKVGRYYCSATATAVTLKNCPVDQAFMMEVYSPLSTTLDNEDTAKYVYRLRKITHYYTGVQYVQYIGSGSTPGVFTYGPWYAIPQVSVTMDSSDTNGSSCAKGSATKPVYINAAGQFVECNSYPTIPTKLPANGGNADTVDNKHASDFATANHTTPVYTACTSSADGTGGHIPAPIAGQQHQLLSGGYNWATLGVRNSSTPYKMYLTFTDSAGNRTDISNCTLTAPVVATDKNGLCPVLPNDTSLFLRGDGQWAAPPKQTVDGGTTTDNDTKNTAGATNSTSKLFLIGAPSQTASSVTYSNSLCYATDGYLYSNDKKVSVEGHNHNSSYLGWNRGALNVNNLYDGGIYMIASGSNLPFGSQYAQVLNLPYRNLTGNKKPDFGAQIALPNGDDASKPNSMFFRTSLSDTWNAWQEVSVVGHKHTKSDITDFPSSLPANGGSADYAGRLGTSTSYHTKATIDNAINAKWTWNENTIKAVKVNNAGAADYATAAGTAEKAANANLADYATTAGLAEQAANANLADHATNADNAIYASDAGYARLLGDSTSYHTKATIDAAINAKWTWNTDEIKAVINNGGTVNYATNTGSADYATNAGSAASVNGGASGTTVTSTGITKVNGVTTKVEGTTVAIESTATENPLISIIAGGEDSDGGNIAIGAPTIDLEVTNDGAINFNLADSYIAFSPNSGIVPNVGKGFEERFNIGSDAHNNSRFCYGYFSKSVYAANGFYESSDERLKNFLNPIDVDLDKLSQLRKSYFTWKKTNEDATLNIGVSAQEVQALFPEVVNTTKDGYLNVAYDKLSVVALAAIDKLHAENKNLKNTIESLEERLAKLETYVDALINQ